MGDVHKDLWDAILLRCPKCLAAIAPQDMQAHAEIHDKHDQEHGDDGR